MTAGAQDNGTPSGGITAAISLLGQGSQQIAGLVITLLAAGFLGAAQYGTYALAVVFVEFVTLLTYVGFYHFLVTSDAEEDDVLSTIFWVILGIGILGGALMVALAAPAAHLFDAPELAGIMRAYGLMQPLSAVVGWASAALTRAGRMRRFFLIQLAINSGAMLAGALTLILWQSLHALVLYQALRVLIGLVLFLHAVPQLPRWRFDIRLFRSAARYALGLYGARSLTFFSVYGVDILLALLFSTAESGLYRFANRLAMAAVDVIAQPLRSFSLKSFGTAARHHLPLTPLFTRYFTAALLLIGGAGATVLILGGAVVETLFRAEYLLAIGAVQALALRAAARVGQAMVEPTFAATGRTTIAALNNLVVSCAMIALVVAVAPFGFVTLAWAQAGLQLLSIPFSLWMIARFAPVDIRAGLGQADQALLLLAGYGVALWLGWQGLEGQLPPGPLRLTLGLCLALGLGGVAALIATRQRLLTPALFAG
ncbi:oligosaccharide flippase family protein [Pseudooceanicola sp.]|uniref:oligosaccharide flippase family protein n=1 Tax=Pseudooceanicola sp. TaxID=1914328 RepID=UPI0035C6CDD0